jgi:hypothetical protein
MILWSEVYELITMSGLDLGRIRFDLWILDGIDDHGNSPLLFFGSILRSRVVIFGYN